MKPHKHAELIKAWADGAEIEWAYLSRPNNWITTIDPNWNEPLVTFRIKPEPKPDVEELYYTKLDCFVLETKRTGCCPNLKLTFDGETGELKSAEVLK